MLRRIKNDKSESVIRPTSDGAAEVDPVLAGLPAPALEETSSKGRAARLGDILREERIITARQLEEGLAKQKEMGGFLGQALVELGHIDQDTLTLVLVKQCKIPHLNLHEYSISKEVLSLIPPELCGKYHLLPVDKMGKILTVAMVDPLDVDALAAIRGAFPDLRIKPILCDWPHFQEVFKRIEQAPATPAPAPAPAPENHAPAAPAPQKPQAEVPIAKVTPAPTAPPVPVHAEKPAAPAEIPVVAIAAPVAEFDPEAITTAIREGFRETMSTFEQRLAEAAELLRAVQEAEKNIVAAQTKEDLGVPAPASVVRRIERVVALAPAVATEGADARVLADLERGTPRVAYSFDTFFIGTANRPALDMAKAIAAGSGRGEFNPFFLCGDVGLGKTHLISAIGNAMLERDANLRIGWTSAGRFADHAIAALEEKAQEEFRLAYSQWDALILDDIQFLGGRIEAQEELFHVFNALLDQGRQIVIAGDRMPDKLGLLEKRLVSRFDSGQVARIHAPEWDARIHILRHHAQLLETAAPEEVLAMIAMRYPADVRRLIGALRKVAARAKLQGRGITAALAGEILAESGAEAAA